jgi:hypothetical protein
MNYCIPSNVVDKFLLAKKPIAIAVKGQNKIHEIVILSEHTRDVYAAGESHVTENRGTCGSQFMQLS